MMEKLSKANKTIIICFSCLSTDRKLAPLLTIKEICFWKDIEVNIDQDAVCWECAAIIRKLSKFKNQIKKAQAILKNQVKIEDLKSLSNLKYVVKQNFEAELDYAQEKEEPPEFFEFNNINEESLEIEVNVKNELNETDHNSEVDNEDIKENVLKVAKKKNEKHIDVKKNDIKEKNVKKRTLKIRKHWKMTLQCKFNIKIMSQAEMEKSRDQDRQMKWYRGCQYKCESCIVGYKNKLIYEKHVALKHSEKSGKYICDICKVHFSTKKHLVPHCMSHYKLYECKICLESHHQLKVMSVHCMKQHEDRKYACRICGAEFSTYRTLRYHRDINHKEKPKCDECGRVFSNDTNLKRHSMLHAGIPMLQCPICQKLYKGQYGLNAHMRFHNNTAPTELAYCAECNMQFKNVILYKSHLKKSSRHVAPELKKHACPECGKRFLEKKFLERHYDCVHLKKREHVCHVCCKMYAKSYSLRQHIKFVHEGSSRPRNKVCGVCNKRFTCKAFLKQHLNSHTGDRPYQCRLCTASFGYASSLYMHIKLIHQKVKRGAKGNIETEQVF